MPLRLIPGLNLLDIKRIQTARLLIDLQKLLFRGIEDEVTYQETLYDIHKRACWNDWEGWILTEDKYIQWRHQKRSHLCYVHTEQIQMSLTIKRIEAVGKIESRVPVVYIFWSQGMTRRSALISIIYQILKQRADILLYRNSPDFYLTKLRTSSRSFELLWKTFLEILFMLPGLLCSLSLPEFGKEQDDFIQSWFNFFESWSGPPVNCIIYQSTSSRYSEFRQRVDLDNLYDLESSLDVCENISHVIQAEASRHSILKQVHVTLWDNLWRATKYYFLVVSFKEYINAVNKALMAVAALNTQNTSLKNAGEPNGVMEFLIRWSNTEKTICSLRRHFTIAMHYILPLLIPEAARTHLQTKAKDVIATATHSKNPKRVNATVDHTQPSEAEVLDIDWNTLTITPASRSTI
ncbi:MAG: hypothetical protein Q9214_006466, partial [Letrouitia sp. 1 TL-2023]